MKTVHKFASPSVNYAIDKSLRFELNLHNRKKIEMTANHNTRDMKRPLTSLETMVTTYVKRGSLQTMDRKRENP